MPFQRDSTRALMSPLRVTTMCDELLFCVLELRGRLRPLFAKLTMRILILHPHLFNAFAMDFDLEELVNVEETYGLCQIHNA